MIVYGEQAVDPTVAFAAWRTKKQTVSERRAERIMFEISCSKATSKLKLAIQTKNRSIKQQNVKMACVERTVRRQVYMYLRIPVNLLFGSLVGPGTRVLSVSVHVLFES